MEASVFLFHLLELMAAIAASYYWLKTKDETVKPFVWYLWLIVFVETLGMYPYLYGIMDNSFINAIENSIIRRNSWLYNIYEPIAIILIGKFLIVNIESVFSRKVISWLFIGFALFTFGYYILTNSFFEFGIPYNTVISTFVVFIMVMLYLRDLIRSDKILSFYKTPVFYVTVALLLWYICLAPLFIFNSFYLTINEEFVEFRRVFLDSSNIILYSWYIFAFLFPLRYKMRLVLS